MSRMRPSSARIAPMISTKSAAAIFFCIQARTLSRSGA
jgi:hypothetical protein